ncbi:hypothetical protein D1P53_002237 [Cryptococcus gattii VGV]|nr:hypothetical protein D1P53_002237 [Cryptococcus gattii VGV]
MTSMHLSSSHDPKSKTFEALAPVAYLILDQLSIIAPTKALLISKYYYDKVIPSLYYSVPLNDKLIYGLESGIPSSFDRTIKALSFHHILRVENMESVILMKYYLAPFPNPQDVDVWEFQPMNHERIEFIPWFTSEVRILIQLKENVKYTSDSDWEDAFGRPFWKAIVLAIADNAVAGTAALSVDEDETDAFCQLMFYIPQTERFKQLIEKEDWGSLLDDEEEKRLFELYWKDWMVIEEADRNLLDEHGYRCRSWSNMEVQT